MLRTHVIALPLLLVLTLTGCGSPPVALRDLGGPGDELPFASEEEALAAAIEVYDGYQSAYDRIVSGASDDPGELRNWLTSPYLELELRGIEELADNGWEVVGNDQASDFSLVWYRPQDSREIVAIRFCNDLNGVDIVDRNGSSVVSRDRPKMASMAAVFSLEYGRLLVVDRVLEAEQC